MWWMMNEDGFGFLSAFFLREFDGPTISSFLQACYVSKHIKMAPLTAINFTLASDSCPKNCCGLSPFQGHVCDCGNRVRKIIMVACMHLIITCLLLRNRRICSSRSERWTPGWNAPWRWSANLALGLWSGPHCRWNHVMFKQKKIMLCIPCYPSLFEEERNVLNFKRPPALARRILSFTSTIP